MPFTFRFFRNIGDFMELDSKKENYDFLDLVKFILSLMIVAIHSSLFPMYLYPWLRIAIPIFFITSSYLFFKKINKLDDARSQKISLKKFTIKNLKLWCIWTLIFLPAVAYLKRSYFVNGVIDGILKTIISLLLGSGFVGGWFLIALIEAVAIAFFLSKRIKNIYLLIIGLVLNLFACFDSSYLALLNTEHAIPQFFEKFLSAPINIPLTIFSAFIWVIIGKLFAENKYKLKLKWNIIIDSISAICLYLEWWILYRTTSANTNDCYVFLIPLCISLFAIIEYFKSIKVAKAKMFRKASIIIYVTHGITILGFRFVIEKILNKKVHEIIVFILTVSLCFSFSLLVTVLEKRKGFKWLKNLY